MSEHNIVDMDSQEAYPAAAGIKCAKCGKCRLNWGGFGPKFERELSPGCAEKPQEPEAGKAHNV